MYLEDGSRQDVVAPDFRTAMLSWERFGRDPRTIERIEEIRKIVVDK